MEDPERCRQDIIGLQIRGQGGGEGSQHAWSKS